MDRRTFIKSVAASLAGAAIGASLPAVGPTQTPVLITSFEEFVATFGAVPTTTVFAAAKAWFDAERIGYRLSLVRVVSDPTA